MTDFARVLYRELASESLTDLNVGSLNWTPAQITTAVWFDASDADSITESSGSVSQWDDKSGNSVDVTQGTGANQPQTGLNTLNGLNVLTFDGNDELAIATNSITRDVSSFTFMVVLKPDTNLFEQEVFITTTASDTTRTRLQLGNTTNVRLEGRRLDADSFASTTFSTYTTDATLFSAIFDYDNAEVNFAKNGVLETAQAFQTSGNSSDTSSTRFDIGVNFQGQIAEIVALSSDTTEANRQIVEGYLAWKWGLETLLPIGHPYKYNGKIFGFSKYWSPNDINTAAWFDAADLETITEAAGSVSQWDDKSNSGNNVVQATGSLQPTTGSTTLNGLNTFDFDGGDLLAASTNSISKNVSSLSIYAVVNPDSNLFEQEVFITTTPSDTTRTRLQLGNSSDIRLEGRRLDSDSFVSTTFSTYAASPSILAAIFDYENGQVNISKNGTLETPIAFQTAGNTSDTTSTRVDIGNAFNGEIAEIIAVADDTSIETRQLLEGHLAWKWGLKPNLPLDHPYRFDSQVFGDVNWTPNQITTTAWYDASNSVSIVDSAGAVSQWNDLSGNDYNLAQGVSAARPTTGTRTLNGLNAIDFDGTTDFMSISAGPQMDSDSMFFAVVDMDDVDDRRIITFQVGTNTRFGCVTDPTDKLLYQHNSSLTPGEGPTLSATSYLVNGYRDSATIGIGVNGSYTNDGTSGDVTGLDSWYVGCYNGVDDFFSGGMCEIILVKDYDISNRQLIEGYLAWKWGGV